VGLVDLTGGLAVAVAVVAADTAAVEAAVAAANAADAADAAAVAAAGFALMELDVGGANAVASLLLIAIRCRGEEVQGLVCPSLEGTSRKRS
jgi:hypothetical protein